MSIKPHTPHKLPIKISYEELVSAVAQANASIARLDTLMSQLPNPDLLSRTFITKEAVLSSQIEGTQASLLDVLEQEAMGVKEEYTEKGRDIKEILNYRDAMDLGVKALNNKEKISEKLILDLHKILLRSVRGHNKKPGGFRDVQVYIGRPGLGIEHASYIPPEHVKVPDLMKNLIEYMNTYVEKDRLVQTAMSHSQFEAIHPFIDGNGRVGRLLISLFLYEKKILTKPFLYISEYFEAHRPEYYALLKGVTENDDWHSWILFFLQALDEQARKVTKVSQDILDLYRVEKDAISKYHSAYALDLLDAVFMQPVFSTATIRKLTSIKNTQTLFTIIEKFEKEGILVNMTPGKKRGRIYMFKQLIDLVEK